LKKRYFIVLVCSIILFLGVEVRAVDLSYKNVCGSNSGIAGDGSCLDQNLKSTSTLTPGTDPEPLEKPSIDAVILLDTSGSMQYPGYSDKSKIVGVNDILKNIAIQIFNINADSTIKVCPFNDSCKTYDSGDEFYQLSGGNLWGYTKIQENYKRAYNELKDNHGFSNTNEGICENNKSIPMVFLITDGYANRYSFDYAIHETEVDYYGNYISAKTFYWTLRTLEQLKEEICGVKIITFGVGMNPNDALAKYVLDPSEINYKNLTEDSYNISTEAQTLKGIVGEPGDSYTGYEFVASLVDSADYGLFKGSYDYTGKSYDGENKTILGKTNTDRSRITFTFGNNNEGLTDEFKKEWRRKEEQQDYEDTLKEMNGIISQIQAINDEEEIIDDEGDTQNRNRHYAFRFVIPIKKYDLFVTTDSEDNDKLKKNIRANIYKSLVIRVQTTDDEWKVVCGESDVCSKNNDIRLIRMAGYGNDSGSPYLLFGWQYNSTFFSDTLQGKNVKAVRFVFRAGKFENIEKHKDKNEKKYYRLRTNKGTAIKNNFRTFTIGDLNAAKSINNTGGKSATYAEHLFKRDGENKIVTASFLGSSFEIKKYIDVEGWSNIPTNVEKKVPVYEHSLCSPATSINLGDLYVRTESLKQVGADYYARNLNNGTIEATTTTCAKVTVNIPVIVTTDSDIKFGKPGGSQIYAGGGFPLGNTTLTNNVYWYYQWVSANNKAAFKLNYWLAYRFGAVERRSPYVDTDYKDLNDITLYTDASCNSPINDSGLEERVWNQVKSKIYDNKNSTLNGVITSIDSNATSDFGNFDSPLNMTVNSDESKVTSSKVASSIVNITTIGNKTSIVNVTKNPLTLNYTLSLKNAAIDPTTAKVTYPYSDGSGLVDGGNKYYVPLKFPDNGKVQVKTYSSIFSSVRGVDITYNISCPISVKQILYDCPSGDCTNKKTEVKYIYRPIDVENPFPKTSDRTQIPDNWKVWWDNNIVRERLKNSYKNYPNNPLYRVVLNDVTMKEINDNSSSYVSWSSMSANGASSFVNDPKIFEKHANNRSYCGLGIWESSCDELR